MSASEKLERLEREGAEGEWAIYEETHHEPDDDPKYTERWITDNGVILNWGDGSIPLGPALLIVSLRNALPQLIALVKAAEEAADQVVGIPGKTQLMLDHPELGDALAALDRKLNDGH